MPHFRISRHASARFFTRAALLLGLCALLPASGKCQDAGFRQTPLFIVDENHRLVKAQVALPFADVDHPVGGWLRHDGLLNELEITGEQLTALRRLNHDAEDLRKSISRLAKAQVERNAGAIGELLYEL